MKVKPIPTSPKSRYNKEDTISDLYNNDMKKIERAKKNSPGFFSVIIISIIFGSMAGILSIILFFMYSSDVPLLKDISLTNSSPFASIIIKQQKNNGALNNSEIIVQATNKIIPAMVDIFIKKPVNDDNLNDVYLTSDRKGIGLFLTDSGLIITTNDVVNNLDQEYIAITSDRQLLQIISLIEDPLTPVVFLKTEIKNQPVIDIEDLENLSQGEEVIVIHSNINTHGHDIVLTNLKNINYKNVSSIADLLQSSEGFSQSLLLDNNFNNDVLASPVISQESQVIGLMMKDENLNVVFPLAHIKSIISGVLKSDKIERPYLGVKYIDLAYAINIPDKLSQNRSKGALIYNPEPKKSGIEQKSPAQKAGLNDLDIILKINNNIIDQKKNLTDYIQEYKIGDIVAITFLRAGIEKELKVELEKTPTK